MVGKTIIQVFYFKYTGGKRFFKMAPLHHHYELLFQDENIVVQIFWTITAALILIGLLSTPTT